MSSEHLFAKYMFIRSIINCKKKKALKQKKNVCISLISSFPWVFSISQFHLHHPVYVDPNGPTVDPQLPPVGLDPLAFCRSHSSSCLRFVHEFGSFNGFFAFGQVIFSLGAVDGWNPAQPPGLYKTLQILGKTTHQLMQDFSHQQYGNPIFQSFIILRSRMLRVNSLYFRCVTGNIAGTFDVKMAHTLEIQHGCQQNDGWKLATLNGILGYSLGPV